MKIPKPKKPSPKRKLWQINPVSRIVEDKTKYSRARRKQAERQENNEANH